MQGPPPASCGLREVPAQVLFCSLVVATAACLSLSFPAFARSEGDRKTELQELGGRKDRDAEGKGPEERSEGGDPENGKRSEEGSEGQQGVSTGDGKQEDEILKEESTEDEVWTREESEEEEESWEEEEEEEEEYFVPEEPAEREVSFEFRKTDIFDEPLFMEPTLAPLPDGLYYLSYRGKVGHNNLLKIEHEHYSYADDPDSGWVMLFWERTLSTGGYLDLDVGYLRDEDGQTGFWLAGAFSWSPLPNLDLYARLQGGRSLEDKRGWRVSGKAKAAFGAKTALQARGLYFRDEMGANAVLGQLELAQYLGRKTGLHALVRGSMSADELGVEASWKVASVELRHRFGEGSRVRLAYRSYDNSDDVFATGLRAGLEQRLKRVSLGAFYCRHRTTEDVVTGTWRFSLKIRF